MESFRIRSIPILPMSMNHWENFTCLSFVPYNPSLHKDYIIFTSDKCGCCSYVGRRGGPQIISIGNNCDKLGIVVHELGHVVGFWHEHTRPDRDLFVDIFHDNIQEGQDYNFDKAKSGEINSLGETYDYWSIMHYARDTFSRAAYLDTILPKKPSSGVRPKIGQRLHLSKGDIRQANKLYSCPACFQTYFGPFGELQISPNSTHCFWRIRASAGEHIVLNISTLLIPQSSRSCVSAPSNFIIISDGVSTGSSIIREKLCGGIQQKMVVSLSNTLMIEMKLEKTIPLSIIGNFKVQCGGTIRSENGTIQSPRFPEFYPPESKCIWNISVEKNFLLEAHKDCSYDNLKIYEVEEDTSAQKLLGTFCGQNYPVIFSTNVSNQLRLQFSSDASIQKRGFHLEFFKEIDECKLDMHNCDQICVNSLGSYKCECYNGFSLKSDGRTCERTCGGIFTADSANFSSPNFPSNYSSNLRCMWEIAVDEYHQIFLEIPHLEIEGMKSECAYDFLHISHIAGRRNGELRLCGSYTEPLFLKSISNRLKLVFQSDASMERSGFTVNYVADLNECAKENAGCSHICENKLGSYECRCPSGFTLAENRHKCVEGGCSYQLYEPAGRVVSPHYPDFYPNNRTCKWHILTTPGHRIVLEFHIFAIEDHSACKYDKVQVYDGGDEMAPFLGKFCGSAIPPELESSGNQLFIEMLTDETNSEAGFNATYESECGGQLYAESSTGFIYSHAYYGDRKYEKSSKCQWEIIADPESNVKLLFTQFSLESEDTCEYDFVAIFDGEKREKKMYGPFCGDIDIETIITESNKAIIEFQTDDTVEQKGFIIEYASSRPVEERKPSKFDSISVAIEKWATNLRVPFYSVVYQNHGNPNQIWNVNDWRDNIITAIDESVKIHGQNPVVVGSSAGCQAVLRAALARAPIIRGLVLFSPGVGLDLNYMERVLPGAVVHLKQGRVVKHPAMDPNLDIRVDLSNLMEFVDNCPLKPNKPISLNCPIRIVHGLKDRLVPFANSLNLLSLLETQHKALTLINDGHFITDETVIHESLDSLWKTISSLY
uniref:Metalloendopeptidase n=1 Tax=Acrobeloides nanus TaxID=290746 RepID=A0A914DQL4_9BILA